MMLISLLLIFLLIPFLLIPFRVVYKRNIVDIFRQSTTVGRLS